MLFWSAFFPAFSRIRTEYGEIRNAEKCGENAGQNNSEYGLFYAVSFAYKKSV